MQIRPSQWLSKRLLSSCLGVLAALLVFEVALRPFVAGWNYPAGSVREIRQYTEGVAVSHYVPDGFATYGYRVTGNGLLRDAPVGLILSDSHGIAESVPDQSAMGSIIERLSRGDGQPLSVLMYGWTGAAAPTYVAVAEDLVRKWNPSWVAVVLNDKDFSAEPLYGLGDAWYWQMKIKPDLSIELVDLRPSKPAGPMESIRQFIGRSTLALALRRRTVVLASAEQQQPQPVKPTTKEPDRNQGGMSLKDQLPLIPRASVRALKLAYGPRLLVVYTPYCNVTGHEAPDNVEKEMFRACQVEAVRCVSVRKAMIAVRDRGQLARGFSNTTPGVGHLNELGHQIVAEEIWRIVSTDGRDPARQ